MRLPNGAPRQTMGTIAAQVSNTRNVNIGVEEDVLVRLLRIGGTGTSSDVDKSKSRINTTTSEMRPITTIPDAVN
mgnify:CR=1 FL=1